MSTVPRNNTDEGSSPLSQIVAEIERAYRSGDLARTAETIENHLLAAWFGIHPSRFGEILSSVLRDDRVQSPVLTIIFSMLFGLSSSGEEGEEAARTELPGSLSEEGPQPTDASLRTVARMFERRLEGRPVEALELAEELERLYAAQRSVFDGTRGWRLFSAVQHGLTAMLAGEFAAALVSFTRARMHIEVPALAFLSRDACVKAALIEALYGDTEKASCLLDEADRVPRTSSWAEVEIDANYRVAAAMCRSSSPEQMVRALESVPLRELGETWPFHLVSLQRALLANGDPGEALRRVNTFEQLPLPSVEGEGYSGSALQLSAALNALARGDLSEARARLDRADGSIVATKVLWALFELASGRPREALRLASMLRDETQDLRRLDLWRLATLAGAYLALGSDAECAAVIEHVLRMPRIPSAIELGFFPADVREFAEARYPEWPRRGEGSAPAFRPFSASGEVLTEREFEVLRLLSRGLSREQIASEQFIALNTLKGHLRSLYRKLNVGSRAAAVLEGERRGLL